MTIGTLFTLFVVPAMYLYLGRDIAPDPVEDDLPTDTAGASASS